MNDDIKSCSCLKYCLILLSLAGKCSNLTCRGKKVASMSLKKPGTWLVSASSSRFGMSKANRMALLRLCIAYNIQHPQNKRQCRVAFCTALSGAARKASEQSMQTQDCQWQIDTVDPVRMSKAGCQGNEGGAAPTLR